MLTVLIEASGLARVKPISRVTREQHKDSTGRARGPETDQVAVAVAVAKRVAHRRAVNGAA
jgi:hypothetical protein